MLYSDDLHKFRKLPGDIIFPPVIFPEGECHVFRAGSRYRKAMDRLGSGDQLIIEGSYPTAIALYSWVKKKINAEFRVTGYKSSRKNRQMISEVTGNILIKIKDHKVGLEKSPEIPWLKWFYPQRSEFFLTLPDILGLNGSWQWYNKGASYPVLKKKVHPFYGVYFPTRTDHLKLFDSWLAINAGKISSATDIGTGCGILSFIMAARGIKTIRATDINPNAVFSASEDARRLGISESINTRQASFFGSGDKVGGLVVFNPPWIPGESSNIIDKGIYYGDGFFTRFFNQAEEKMLAGSILCIIFSSFATAAGISKENPVELEIKNSQSFTLKEKLSGTVKERSGSRSRSWINEIRSREKTELWILKKL